MARTLALGTRSSALALTQAGLIKKHLEGRGLAVDLREFRTTGDRILDIPLSQIGDKALFTKELDHALLEGSIHLAVHSLKDLPTTLPRGIRIGAITSREEARDVFVAHPDDEGSLAELPEGARIGTSSLRRKAQLLAWRSDLEVSPVRGNVDTRLRKLDGGDWDGLVLAYAGLARLGLSARIREVIDTDVMLPAVGQGALAVVCSEEDEETYSVLRDGLHDEMVGREVEAERAMLRRLEGGCSVPVGALARTEAGKITLEGCVVSLDGRQKIRARLEGPADSPERIGEDLAEELLRKGAGAILAEIRETTV